MTFLAAFWGGLPAALGVDGAPAALAYRRARGVDPSVSEITFPRAMFSESLAPLLDGRRFMPPDEGSFVPLESSTGVPLQSVARPPYMGDMVFVQESNGEKRTARARALYLDQAVVVNPRMESPSVTFTLSDIRKWWANYGEITRSWNVRRGDARTIAQGFGLGAQDVPDADADGRIYVAHTAKDGGREPYTLREIAQALLDALPGRLQIIRWPTETWLDGSASETGGGQAAPEVKCWGASPKEALRGVLAAFRLSLDIGSDLKARVYGPNEGEIGALIPGDPENLPMFDPEAKAGPWASRITADGNRYARRPTGAPARVLVVGDRTIYDVAQDACTPVLVYPLEREGRPPETIVMEVTPANLAALARGARDPSDQKLLSSGTVPAGLGGGASQSKPPVAPDPYDQHAVKVLMGSAAPPIPVVAQAGGGEVPAYDPYAGARATGDPFVWQRLPLLDDRKVEEAFPWLPLGVRSLLRDQLWRYYQVPIRRLTPLLKRAERSSSGERLEIQVEAFTFRSVSARRLTFVDDSVSEKQRQADLAKHRFLRGEISRLSALRDALKRPTIPQILMAVRDFLARNPAADEDTLRRAGLAFEEAARGWLLAVPPDMRRFFVTAGLTFVVGVDAEKFVADLEAELAKAALAGEADPFKVEKELFDSLSGGPGAASAPAGVTGGTADQVNLRLKLVEDGIEAYEKEARELFSRLFPVNALMADLANVETEISNGRAATGEDPPAAVLRRNQLKDQIAKQNREDKQRSIEERKPKYESRLRHENLARQVVSARVVDAELGIIEVLGALPCWLGDLGVKETSSSYLVPMPVRVTHGSWCARDVDGRGEAGEDQSRTRVSVEDPLPANPYIETALNMIASMKPEGRALVGSIGDTVPEAAGSGQFAVEFRRDGFVRDPSPEPGAWLVTMHQSPPFRELVRLDGSSNREELEAKARPFALSLLDTPDHVDAGSLTLRGPEEVGCNGRISAVAVRFVNDGDAYGFVTDVSFDGDTAPLPGIVGRESDGGPVRLVFGLDPDATRDR